MKELVQFLTQQLVNNPDAVEVKEAHGDSASALLDSQFECWRHGGWSRRRLS
jgi:hypothetical protein